MLVPVWLQAGFWGLLAGSALLVGAAVGFFARVPQRWIAAVMAFGGGVLISALAFDLMDEAYKRSGGKQPSEQEDSGSGLAIAVGALLDGIPESIVIGVSMIGGGAVSTVTSPLMSSLAGFLAARLVPVVPEPLWRSEFPSTGLWL